MPVKSVKRGGKFRVVEVGSGKIAKNKGGTAADGGGHGSKSRSVAQVQAINLSQRRRQGKSAPPRPRRRR